MTSAKYMFYAILASASLTSANPINAEARSLFQFDSGITKRALFNVDDIPNEDQKKFLREAHMEAVDIAATALKLMNVPKYAGYLGRWFGEGEDVHDNVLGVLTNFVGDNKSGEGSSILNSVKVYNKDYWTPIKGDSTLFCDIQQNGRTGAAYFKSKDKKPGMHYCPKFFERVGKDEYLKGEKCPSIADHINTDTIGRKYRGANVLHEYMHYDQVGKAQIGQDIADPAYGAYSSYVYKDMRKDNAPPSVANADTYVYYTMHIWLTENCHRDFAYPRDTSDD